ncbi:nitrate- and nitrite sensing domain-containing protein [Streptomyces sp. MUM 203J]|uniref:sensor histidine kinase n=1 Tax=Streptomyces sp. MUM 203J TaxID=2791990 RepID=UPI001F03E26E|nr:nitrate- and nitrite sensing domain-containing protein [Streptomyces sp. MUM 203J]MCH0538221.1 nitrate- and nitrite sensing domain-containing protein [Streptomyces sp. MUM 203J]
MAGVALVGITVVGAGAPGLLATSADLTESQGLVTLAKLNRQAVTLAHSLADERDAVTEYVAAGRNTGEGATDDADPGRTDAQDGKSRNTRPPGAGTARVDRQIAEIRAAAPEDLRRVLAGVPELRRTALTGTGTALEVHRSYTEVIGRLQALAARLSDRTPARADSVGRAPAELGQATERASATRGLLLAALAVPGTDAPGHTEFDPATGTYVTREDPAAKAAARTRDQLSGAAHLARVREQVALADFGQEDDPAAHESLAATVTGPEVTAAEKFLGTLTDRTELSEKEQRTDPEKLEAALTARVEQMRGVESALATARIESMERLRDEDVTTLELRIALLGGCLLVAVAVSTAVARSLTRPLAVLRRGAARLADSPSPQTEEPIRFTGRNDEFAQAVRSLNTLHGKLQALAARAQAPDAPVRERTPAAGDGGPESAATELAAHRTDALAQTRRLAAELERLRHTADDTAATSVNLSLRTLALVERQLTVIEKLEEREQDPERLATLFRLDHMATVMRRHCENLLVLSGHEHRHAHQEPVPLVDVLRAAVSEIEQYERVAIQSLPPHTYVAGDAADDLSHLLAELLENATLFSAPDAGVRLSAWLVEGGDVTVSVSDSGVGATRERLAALNARLAEPSRGAPEGGEEGDGLGLRVTALLAARHGVRVELQDDQQGGVTAVAVLPQVLLPEAPLTAGPPAVALAQGAPTLTLPGTVAEANENALPPRPRPVPPGAVEPEPETAEASGADGSAPEPPAPEAPGKAGVGAFAPGAEDDRPAAETGEGPQPGAVEPGLPGAAGAPGAPATPPEPEAAGFRDAGTPDAEPAQADVSGASGAVGDGSAPGPRDPEPEVTATGDHAAAEAGSPPTGPDPRAPEAGVSESGARTAEAQTAGGDQPEGHRATPSQDVTPVSAGAEPQDSEAEAAGSLEHRADASADDHEPAPDAREATLQVRLPQQGGAEAPGRAAADPASTEPASLTGKGLPKRTPQQVDSVAPRPERTGQVDAEELRRRLGGFQRGAEDGRRAAEAEAADGSGTTRTQETEASPGTGDTGEEARS